MKRFRLLCIDDNPADRAALVAYLTAKGFDIEAVGNSADALATVKREGGEFAAIVLDYTLEGDPMTAPQLIEAIHEIERDAYVLVYTGDTTQEAATQSWSAGAVGFVAKGAGDALYARLREQCEKFDSTLAVLSADDFRSPNQEYLARFGWKGRSNALVQLIGTLLLFRDCDETVLVTGESGVGKELAAKLLHTNTKPFVAINSASFANSDFLESELFGHEKGAYTGANDRKLGLLEAARGGTVFLDEIHHLGLKSQAKLLRAVESKIIRRMNGVVDIPVDFRLVCASNTDLEKLAARREFLPDLFHRISKLKVNIPPLRERRDDIAPLIHHFAEYYRKKHQKAAQFRKRTVRIMESYDWASGNIRELDNVVCNLIITTQGKYIEPEQLHPKFFQKAATSSETWEDFQRKQYDERRDFLYRVCEASLNKAQAARALGVQSHAIHALLKNYRITWESRRPTPADSERVVLK